ncbi:DUF523 domain-containing protein [Klebsiella pneumoniae]|uniref:DUF523 domain-containing protein n=1 Tax=Klebsiella pneumoniae TaxID=573 RepID=A0A939NP69_KLEPN|nr:DUF523 domain-containing protein [Klebsiella pneumoniae]
MIHCPELAAGLLRPDCRRRSSAVPAAMCLPDGRGSWKATAATSPDIISWPLAAGAQRRPGSGLSAALLTDGSPTCGSQFVYDGSFRGRRKAGAGVAADLLPRPRHHGIFRWATRSCSPGWHRRSRMMIQCKRV